MELDQTPNERSRFGALFPEVPVEAERQTLYLSLLVGALVFSAIMGWGPHGRWLNGIAVPKATTKQQVTTPRNDREGPSSAVTAESESDIEAPEVPAASTAAPAIEDSGNGTEDTELDSLEFAPTLPAVESEG